MGEQEQERSPLDNSSLTENIHAWLLKWILPAFVRVFFFSPLAKRSDTQWPAAWRGEDEGRKTEVQVWRLPTGPVLILYFHFRYNIDIIRWISANTDISQMLAVYDNTYRIFQTIGHYFFSTLCTVRLIQDSGAAYICIYPEIISNSCGSGAHYSAENMELAWLILSCRVLKSCIQWCYSNRK